MTRLHYLPQLLEAKATRTSVIFLRPVKRNRASRAYARTYVRLESTHDERLAKRTRGTRRLRSLSYLRVELDSHESLNLYVCRPHSCDVVGDDAEEASTCRCLRVSCYSIWPSNGAERNAGLWTFLLWRVCKYNAPVYVCTYVHASAFISVLLLLPPPFCPRFANRPYRNTCIAKL